MVDANGKEIPWIDRDGNILKTYFERYRPVPGQKFFLSDMAREYDYRGPRLSPEWMQKVRSGEYTLPIYADLPSMPELERKALFGLMCSGSQDSYPDILHLYQGRF